MAALSVLHVEFLSQDEVVNVVATAPVPELRLLGGRWGPFAPLRPTPAPLWLALLLKRKRRCRVQPPPWLGVAALQAAADAERSSAHFAELPFHFFPLAYQLFASAPDDVADAEQTRALVEDVRVLRAEKLRAGVRGLRAADEVLAVRGLTSAEVCASRRFVLGAMASLRTAARSAQRVEAAATAAATDGGGDDDAQQQQQSPFVGALPQGSVSLAQRRILRPARRTADQTTHQ